MADGGIYQRRVVLGVDASENCQRAFDSCAQRSEVGTIDLRQLKNCDVRGPGAYKLYSLQPAKNCEFNVPGKTKQREKNPFYVRLSRYVKNMCDKVRDILLIIHARELPTVSAAPYASYGYWYYEEMQNAVDKSAKETKELLEAYGNKCRQLGLNFKLYKEQSNRPGEVICKLAEDDKAHAVVVGARGAGRVRRTYLGSVTQYCVHHTRVPVVVVPPPHHYRELIVSSTRG